METLLLALLTWTTIAAGLPPVAADRLPEVVYTTQENMCLAHYGEPCDGPMGPAALYDPSMARIYLLEDWSAEDIIDVSILVHELVHHAQSEAGVTNESCPASDERLAYEVQEEFMQAAGRSIFMELDPEGVMNRIALLFLTQCSMHRE